MPIPDQVRFFPFGNSTQDPNFTKLWQLYDRLPFFPEYEFVSRPAPVVSTTTTALVGGFDFRKEESWTDMRFTVEFSWYSTVANTGGLPFFYIDNTQAAGLGTCVHNVANSHMPYTQSTVRVSGLKAGLHRCDFYISRYSGTGTLVTDTNDGIHLISHELVPLPSN